ncbi:MAG: AMP-binding protein [Thermoflexus sp.]|jgi:phenylacetate-CoA ligase|nr:AMP-binding protein [Thermoflexus sp.]MDT7884139.1 AMP-binding protein [Thermoflexus sp.]MDT7947694.1 AMP-binding protein [Thermoflexus sp.]
MSSLTAYAERLFPAVHKAIRRAYRNAPGFRARMEAAGLRPRDLRSPADLQRLPVLRKDDLLQRQQADPPFGGMLMIPMERLRRAFQSPGPIYEPEPAIPDPWRWAPALQAAGFEPGDRVLIAFSYHLTPAGAMFEEALKVLGCLAVPGGIGQQELQLQALRALRITAYIGLPSYLYNLMERAQAAGWDPQRDLALRKAFVTAEPLPASLRQDLQRFGLSVRQGYGTAECGCLGYECEREEGLHVPEDAYVELCDPQTGEPVPPGELGEIVVTLFHPAYALIRFGTGDLSRWLPEPCPCGRATPRLAGILGRVGEAVKVRGMFLHPRQMEAVFARFPEVQAYQAVIDREAHVDRLTFRVVLREPPSDPEAVRARLREAIRDGLRFQAEILLIPPEELPPGSPRLLDLRRWD